MKESSEYTAIDDIERSKKLRTVTVGLNRNNMTQDL
jgi:hypothetical protein